jgi:hypothetical protein
MTKNDEKPPQKPEKPAPDPLTEIRDLTADLERILKNPSPHLSSLERQADLLDCLLTAVMRRNVDVARKNNYFREDDIGFALRIQKQCLETMKAAGTVAYMQSIASLTTGVYPPLVRPAVEAHPLPHEKAERTEGH